jgi:hypothetical protein
VASHDIPGCLVGHSFVAFTSLWTMAGKRLKKMVSLGRLSHRLLQRYIRVSKDDPRAHMHSYEKHCTKSTGHLVAAKDATYSGQRVISSRAASSTSRIPTASSHSHTTISSSSRLHNQRLDVSNKEDPTVKQLNDRPQARPQAREGRRSFLQAAPGKLRPCLPPALRII